MGLKLRDYQSTGVDKAISHLKRSIEAIMIEAATGAGKSLMVAEVARIIHQMTGKRVLCTAPSAELVVQNHGKYLATGNPASMFSASAGAKSLRHPVVFGTPLTIKNRISSFQRDFALVVVDECDLMTPTLRDVIDAMRLGNPNLRVFGFTATPYALGKGYIFTEWPDGRVNGEDLARDPYFAKSIYRIDAPYLIEQGYLTPPVIGGVSVETYDTHNLTPNRLGKFDAAAVDRAYHGHGRKTSAIVGDIVAKSRNRQGVLLYAATVQHAREIMASLPPELSAIVTAESEGRKAILDKLRAKRIKYVVNVGVLTVGVDIPHIDVIAVLRKTDSIRLLQQIIGRGLRPVYAEGWPLDTVEQRKAAMAAGGKENCLYLDYTSNIEDHVPDGDLFAPTVRAKKASEAGNGMEVHCPSCAYVNQFTANPDMADYKVDAHGHCLDVFGEVIVTDFGPMAAHFGRRCFGMVRTGATGEYERCSHRWAGKPCPQCGEPNDIAARYCYIKSCAAEIVDPSEKLRIEFAQHKRDPHVVQSDEVISAMYKPGVSQKGNPTVRADFKTPFRQFSVWFSPEAKSARALRDWEMFSAATDGGTIPPKTITYVKEASGFFRVIAFDQAIDVDPSSVSPELELA